jgi:uncharacterized protein YfdQ (DUF2303 family)
MGIFESIDSAKRELAWEEDAVAMRASVAESISAFLSSHDKRRYQRKIIDFISNWKLKLSRSL